MPTQPKMNDRDKSYGTSSDFWHEMSRYYQMDIAEATGIHRSRLSRMKPKDIRVSEFVRICMFMREDPRQYLIPVDNDQLSFDFQ
jgi:hypothetical protein